MSNKLVWQSGSLYLQVKSSIELRSYQGKEEEQQQQQNKNARLPSWSENQSTIKPWSCDSKISITLYNIIWYLNPLGKWNAKARAIEWLKANVQARHTRTNSLHLTQKIIYPNRKHTYTFQAHIVRAQQRFQYAIQHLRFTAESIAITSFQWRFGLDAAVAAITAAIWCYIRSVIALNNSVLLFIFLHPRKKARSCAFKAPPHRQNRSHPHKYTKPYVIGLAAEPSHQEPCKNC